MPEKQPTYEELKQRCEQLEQIANLNRCTVIAQQIEYKRYIAKLEKQLAKAVASLKRRRGI